MLNRYLMETILLMNNIVGLYLFVRFISCILTKKKMKDTNRRLSLVTILIAMTLININFDNLVSNLLILLAINYFIGELFYIGKRHVKLIAAVFFVVFSVITELLTAVIFGLVFDASIIGIRDNEMHLFLGGVISKFLLILFVEIVVKLSKKNASDVSLKSWFLIMSIPLVSIILAVSVVYEPIVNNVFSDTAVLACVAILYINLISVYLFDNIIAQIHENNTIKFREKQLILQQHQYENIISGHENVKRLRHDMLGHLITITEYLKYNKVEDAKSYIGKLHHEIDFIKQGMFSEHIPVDAIVNNRMAKANELGIKTIIDIAIPKSLNVDDVDLCVIIGNLLTNAIEACQRINGDTSKYIKFIMKYKHESIIIESINAYNSQTIKEVNNKFTSSKAFRVKDELGMGLANIESVSKKYNGVFNFDRNNYEFIVKIVIPDKKVA